MVLIILGPRVLFSICRFNALLQFLRVNWLVICFLLRQNLYNIKLTISSEQFSGIYYNHNVVQSPSVSSSKTFSSRPKKASYLLSSHSPLSLSPASGNHQCTFCLYGFNYSRYFFHSACFQGLSIL